MFGAFIFGCVSCARFGGDAGKTAASALGARPDVAAIVSAREAVRQAARARGLQRPVVNALVERRPMQTGGEEHVLLLHVHSRYCNSESEHPLTRLLTADELAALDRERIWLRTKKP